MAKKLALGALVLFAITAFVPWSNPDNWTRGPFVGDYAEPAMLIFLIPGLLAAALGFGLGRKRFGRGLGVAVFLLGLISAASFIGLSVAVGSGIYIGLLLGDVAGVCIVLAGLIAIVKPDPKG